MLNDNQKPSASRLNKACESQHQPISTDRPQSHRIAFTVPFEQTKALYITPDRCRRMMNKTFLRMCGPSEVASFRPCECS